MKQVWTAALLVLLTGCATSSRVVPQLPGAMQAAAQAETQVGIRLAAVAEVETVAVSAEAVTIALAPGTVAMSVQGSGAMSAPLPASGGISVKDVHVDVPKHNLDRLAPTWPEQRQFLIDAVRQLDGKVSAWPPPPKGPSSRAPSKSMIGSGEWRT